VITSGVDLASQASNTAACEIAWSDNAATITGLVVGVDDHFIRGLITRADKVGIDAPFGWPTAFAEAVAQHSMNGSWPGSYDHSDTTTTHRYRYRRTDLWLWKSFKTTPPLSVSTDRIALPAMRTASLLASLPDRTDLDGSGVVVEVYPAAALRQWDMPSQKYKRKENAESRRALVSRFLAETGDWLHIDSKDETLCCDSDDAFDAVICALVARAAATGLVEAIPDADKAIAAKEGWVAVPTTGSLDRLA
jgi:predicted nuclease with RNAse H fold